MKILGLNGSPRLKGNSIKFLTEALRGAADAWIFATPIYNGHMSSSMSALIERFYLSHHNCDAHERMVDKIPAF